MKWRKRTIGLDDVSRLLTIIYWLLSYTHKYDLNTVHSKKEE